ncbi:hypothetical protein EVAR_50422_1 [Eumeta japonica]|uniref:Uncharacterized protein n=1 Tax=Eumeta variegata TaxID=151549 RepID=A0A4C1WXY9_EUMVA|nr:hypothetical protein EVAR_50422_1 [Eumeta japonica]
MDFIKSPKRNVKPLFAARAYKSLAELKSVISNYKQVYEEDRETTCDLPMEWGTKENFQEHPESNDNIDIRPPQTARMEARPYWFRDRGDERRYLASTK